MAPESERPVAFAHRVYATTAADELPDALASDTDRHGVLKAIICALAEQHQDEVGIGGPVTAVDEAAHD